MNKNLETQRGCLRGNSDESLKPRQLLEEETGTEVKIPS